MIEIIIGDFTNKQHTNAVVKLALQHDFYIDQIWNMVLRKVSPRKINMDLAELIMPTVL